MCIQFRNYTNEAGITEDYHKVRAFLVGLGCSQYSYARWDWMSTHAALEEEGIGKIGIWEDANEIVGIATFDVRLGNAYCLTHPNYSSLKKDMLLYAKENLSSDNNFGIVVLDTDHEFQDIAANLGYVPTTSKEDDAIFYLDKTAATYQLPQGFRITSMKETYDPYQYRRVLWKGFNHELDGEGELVFSTQDEIKVHNEMQRPNVDLNLKLAVVAPNGNFVSYCGMWYDQRAGFGVIEPVATDPDYRKMGLGKAVVLEGIKRVGQLGGKTVLVGSNQQFYYSIGMSPYATSTVWMKK
ncbi:hypothetical protein GCM10011351_06630 [Paraliobacillus quinghaiensis]|uniref:N-acetyltransferase domain-containing protein n=1 Tax=Paraliobacillus quinghaiensis TaxID=470815 RepID=A0A917WRL0_9BACI|nr:GNAT family N-acetyltransferase [Paraliobacillus quinghaiensis]GGM23525.1 hypothetical protein GCM10011351_06630 [Paraliobacillus quinghaiensis]